MLVMSLVLGPGLMVISWLSCYAKVSPLFNVLWECIVVVYTKSTLFTNIWTVHCVQNFTPTSLTVFEILVFKLKNKDDVNDKKNWRNRLLPYLSYQILDTH